MTVKATSTTRPPASGPSMGAAARPRRVRAIACAALAVPLLGSAANHALGIIEPPTDGGLLGGAMWRLMRDGGLFLWIVVGHALTGVLLLLPRWRFAGALLQLPVSAGIAAFNLTMFPPGIGVALVMLALNLVAVADPERLRALVGESSA